MPKAKVATFTHQRQRFRCWYFIKDCDNLASDTAITLVTSLGLVVTSTLDRFYRVQLEITGGNDLWADEAAWHNCNNIVIAHDVLKNDSIVNKRAMWRLSPRQSQLESSLVLIGIVEMIFDERKAEMVTHKTEPLPRCSILRLLNDNPLSENLMSQSIGRTRLEELERIHGLRFWPLASVL